MDRGAWQAIIHGAAKESDTTEHNRAYSGIQAAEVAPSTQILQHHDLNLNPMMQELA